MQQLVVFFMCGGREVALTYYREFIRSELESANVRAAPTTTINPNNFGTSTGAQPDNDYRMHFWTETSGATMTGADYSIMSWNILRPQNTLSIGPTSPELVPMPADYTSATTYNDI